MARNSLVTGQGQGQATYQTAPLTPGANRLVLAMVMSRRGINDAPDPPVLAGNSLAWVQVAVVEVAPFGPRLTCFRAMSPAPTAGQLTIAFPRQQTLCAWSVFEYTDVTTTGIAGADAVAQVTTGLSGAATTFGVSLGGAPAAGSTIVAACVVNENRQFTPGAGLVEIHEQNANLGSLQTEDRTLAGQLANWTWTNNANAAAIACEVKAAAVAPPPPPPVDQEAVITALVRKFEPVLFLHPQEKFFPSDAKRYLERCALWRAQTPHDQKSNWGGDGTAPFPRKPEIEKGKIAALGGEPGTFIGTVPPSTRDRELFLELAGWKDSAGTDQPDVTATSKNTYSNRDKIKDLYDNDPGLNGSLYWYHAEFFDDARLRRLLREVTQPDLTKVLDKRMGGNPTKEFALICYYFLFPAHEESLGGGCENIEAKEFACHGGDWACLALLLERDGPSASFSPTFIGHSGRAVYDPADQLIPGQAGGTVVLKVSPATASEQAGSPRVFVAKGTHSLYRDAAPAKTEHETWSYDCGRQETVTLTPPYTHGEFAKDFGIINAKIYGGGIFHIVAGGFALPVGAVAGLTWAIAELASMGSDDSSTSDKGSNDEVAPEGAGRVIHPAGMQVPPTWTDHQPWRSAQNVTIDGRRYDMLVDRSKQQWWPAAESIGGYEGLWGPRVETDAADNRAGKRFPPFWTMFFLALEDGGF